MLKTLNVCYHQIKPGNIQIYGAQPRLVLHISNSNNGFIKITSLLPDNSIRSKEVGAGWETLILP